MSKSALRQLTIEYLRGSVIPFSLPFDKGKKLTVVYGENATGKSTICDAFEFLGKGRVGSLDNRGLGRANAYWPSMGKIAADVSVSFETVDGAVCLASIAKSEVVITPEEMRPKVEVLRRSQILALVDSKPSERYIAISRFIDVSGVETSENNLRQLIQGLKKNREVAVARVQENEDAIAESWASANKPGLDALSWAKNELERDPEVSDVENAALEKVVNAYGQLLSLDEHRKNAEAALGLARKWENEARLDLQKCSESIAIDAKEVVRILEAAQSYFREHTDHDVCPLCESAENADGLNVRIGEKLKKFSSVQTANGNLINAERALALAADQMDQSKKDFDKYRTVFENAHADLPTAEDISLCEEICSTDIDRLGDWLEKTNALAATWKVALANRQDWSRFLSTLRKLVKTYLDNVGDQKEIDALLPELEKAHVIVLDERQKYTDSILSYIATEVGRLYELVHPGEGLNTISLMLDPKKRASLEIGASFCGKTGTPPQAYFSESHLDTLGICIFLALAGMDDPEATVLVLDDVLASVDEPHVERLIEMFYSEAANFRHCVITTHYRPWKQKLRWGWLQNGQCQFVELSKWTATSGLILTRSVPDAERLRSLLAEKSPDPQLVCAKAGVILEAALTFLSQLYECRVPHRVSNLYTLGDLLPSMNKKLRSALTVEVLVTNDAGNSSYQLTEIGPILDELTRIAQARNVFGCHFNILSFDLLEGDAIGFGQQVLSLIDALADPEAGWPKSKKSGKYWSNPGETRRLHPLLTPL